MMRLNFVLLAFFLFHSGCSTSDKGIEISVVSSPVDLISGGEARVEIAVPHGVNAGELSVTLDGQDLTDAFQLATFQLTADQSTSNTQTLSGVVQGLTESAKLLQVTGGGYKSELSLTSHSIAGPMFSGPAQEPFVCATTDHRDNAMLGDIIDDQCAVERVVSFMYKSTTSDAYEVFDPSAPKPNDIAQTTTLEGKTVDFIVRWERGTINRFIYSIATLSPDQQDADTPDLSAWNGRLIYYFQGGVGIGHYQGNPNRERMLYEHGLSKGYAITYSTGTRTSTHYNLEVGGETAIMVKDRFVTAYGKPRYTVGVGGSGGAIQQYVYGQNHKGLIDAGIPQYSYPDMVTQGIHVGDCELLERYMDAEVAQNPDSKWARWSNRTWLQGMNASDTVVNPYNKNQPGNSECINGWRGLSPLSFNPNYGTAPGIAPELQPTVEWTHSDDLRQIYGADENGNARRTWDNVGVQYGLSALHDGHISEEEFLDLNARIGGWKQTEEFVQEGAPYLAEGEGFDVHSARNMNLSPEDAGEMPAKRTKGDPIAVAAAYEHGLVFTGRLDIPIIDWRHYLEDELDMHNAHQSFSSRQRLLNYDNDASNQVIWFTDVVEGSAHFDQTPMAFEVIDQWMSNIAENPRAGVAANKPSDAVDSCFDKEGTLMHAGNGVWDGILNDKPRGACTQSFDMYATSRIVAGAPITGDVFACHLQSVENAIANGLYGTWEVTTNQQERLKEIFPDGVCDYTKGDASRPKGS